jgi:CelD/BcsL family acetyltransferase involved in cellulose biosynthesis
MTAGALRVVVRSELGGMAADWDGLAGAATLPSPFLRSWWLQATARGTPLFVLAHDGDRLAGGLALQRDNALPGLRRLAFMGAGPLAPDHLDAVAAPGRDAAVAAALHEWIKQRRRTLVDLRGAAEAWLLAAVLGDGVHRSVEERAPYTRLPGSAAAYFEGRPPQLRNTIRRAERRLERAGVVSRQVPADDSGRALAALERLHRARWGARSPWSGAFTTFAAAARTGMARGEVAVHELVAPGDEVVATVVMLLCAGRASFYQGGRLTEHRWRGAGTVVLAHAVARACEAGCHELDMLRGDEPYKRLWADRSRAVLRLRTGVGALAAAALRAEIAAGALRPAASRRRRTT